MKLLSICLGLDTSENLTTQLLCIHFYNQSQLLNMVINYQKNESLNKMEVIIFLNPVLLEYKDVGKDKKKLL
jgi:hypothetical protein